MPAASSSIARRSPGLAWMIAPIRPWLTSAGEWAPVAESATLLRAARMSLCQDVDERRMLVVVDDAQHLDELSATLLHQLMIHSQVRLVLTMRDDIEAPAAITALWKDQLVTRLDIEALSREETVELIESVLGGPVERERARKAMVEELAKLKALKAKC